MVFIPGGGLVEEGSSTFGYQAKHIATSGQISVSFNYRVGALGFFALKSLSERDGGDEYSPSGNWGIMDQILALHWVRRNIKNFGGDPDQVTIFGHSSGGTSVYMLLASPLATYRDSTGVEKMLFHRLISMSGSIVINTPLHVSHKENQAIVERTKCKGLIGLHQLECLENVPVEDIINVTLRQSELYPYYNNFTYSQGLPLPGEHQV
jgi:para-nitrobenzyl esterase